MIFDLELGKFMFRQAIASVLETLGPLEKVCAWQNQNFQPEFPQPYVQELVYVVSERRVSMGMDQIDGKACYLVMTASGEGTLRGATIAKNIALALPAAEYLRDTPSGCAIFLQRVERLHEHKHPTLPNWYVHPVDVTWWTHSFPG